MSLNAVVTQSSYLKRKLDHYNSWLLDPSRPLTSSYPGFPEDIKREKAINTLASEVKIKTEARKMRAKIQKKRAKHETGRSKAELAAEFFTKHSGNKDLVVADLQNFAGMSKAGATTYFYNAKKMVNV